MDRLTTIIATISQQLLGLYVEGFAQGFGECNYVVYGGESYEGILLPTIYTMMAHMRVGQNPF